MQLEAAGREEPQEKLEDSVHLDRADLRAGRVALEAPDRAVPPETLAPSAALASVARPARQERMALLDRTDPADRKDRSARLDRREPPGPPSLGTATRATRSTKLIYAKKMSVVMVVLLSGS